MTSFAALLALVAFGPGVTGGALGGDNGTSVGAPGVAGAPAMPPVPAPPSTPTLTPAAPPVPAPTLSPAAVPSVTGSDICSVAVRVLHRPDRFGIESAIRRDPDARRSQQCSMPGLQPIPAAINGVIDGTTTNGGIGPRKTAGSIGTASQWVNYEPAVAAVPDPRYSGQPVYGYYQSIPNAYYPARIAIRRDTAAIMGRSTRAAIIMARAGTTASPGSRSDWASAVESESGGDCRTRAVAFLVPGCTISYQVVG